MIHVPDDRTVEYFVEGNCAQLAFEIHKRTGWKVGLVSRTPHGDDSVEVLFCHMFAIHPDSSPIDIRGKQDIHKFREQWRYYPYVTYFETTRELNKELRNWNDLDYPLGQDPHAKAWAESIIERYGSGQLASK